MEVLKCEERKKEVVHSGKKSRQKGLVPGILYGAQLGNVLFEIGELELNNEISKIGEHGAVRLLINNTEHMAIIKEIQKEPVTRKLIHIDLQEFDNNKIIETEVPIIFTGEDLATKNGGIVQKEKSSVKVQGKYNEIPKAFNINLSNMHLGNVLRLSDIELSSEITFAEDINTVLAVVSRTSVKGSTEE
jgi:large subunit ribosomal protein L25